MADPTIAIIGRGLAGLTLAFRMVESGYRPTLFGAARGPANASRCAQGIVCNKGLIFAESPLFRAKLQTLKKLEAWLSAVEKASGLSIPRTWMGVDEPYWNEEDFQKTVQRVYRGNFWGCYRPRNLPPEKWLADFKTPTGFLHYPDDAWFDVDATMNALEKACERRGAQFSEEAIHDLQPYLTRFDHTVVAAGSDSIRLVQTLGLQVPKTFQVAGQSLVWQHEQEQPPRILVKGTISLAVLPDRKILGSSSWKPDADQEPNIIEDARNLVQQGAAAFGFSPPDPQTIQSRWGTRLRFTDRMPALGLWPDATVEKKLSVLTGFYKNGLQLADLCAEQLLKELQGEPLSEFGEAFHVGRFFRSGRRAPGSPPRVCPLSKSEHKSSTQE
ncbi:MAG TPA: FAD-dependent oxidoreductase [Oligoflexus sp.]|uniref:NAD(P)/FAD-dependent oxidoreductase n=1 Tax=Oligoflexus sp. TaxID=1971216 RepID=UPI002D630833|nr:FAD-dependent oxidoreductase [Oligoflexus sp.]HYX34331.1 FAD-dependent oxidoreductase [Oligoflexus sp.]